MTVNTFIDDRVRTLLGDEGKNTWTGPDLIKKVNQSRDQLWADAPHAFSGATVVTTAPTDLVGSDTLDVSNLYAQALAHRVCFIAFSEDSQDKAEAALAAAHLALYRGEI